MAINASQQTQLFWVFLEANASDDMTRLRMLFDLLFQPNAVLKTTAKSWLTTVRAKRTTNLDTADTDNTVRKNSLTVEVAALDSIDASL